VALERADASEERIASIIRVIIGGLGTLAVTSNRSTLQRNIRLLVTANVPSSPILVTLTTEGDKYLRSVSPRNITEDGILKKT
jgi:hypothetical protein